MSDEKFLDKVRKVLALAENNPSDEEAQAAWNMAQEMLARKGMSLEDVPEAEKPKATHKVAGTDGCTQPPWWHREMAAIVAGNFRCRWFLTHAAWRQKRVVFAGLPEHLEVALEVYAQALAQARRQATAYVASAKAQAQGAGKSWGRAISKRIRNDYIRGWLGGLRIAFSKNVEEKALIVVVPPETKEHLDSLGLVRDSGGRQGGGAGSEEAALQGERDGSRFGTKEISN